MHKMWWSSKRKLQSLDLFPATTGTLRRINFRCVKTTRLRVRKTLGGFAAAPCPQPVQAQNFCSYPIPTYTESSRPPCKARMLCHLSQGEFQGRVAEWSKALDSKSNVAKATVGSNPTPSAILKMKRIRSQIGLARRSSETRFQPPFNPDATSRATSAGVLAHSLAVELPLKQ